MRLQTFLAMGAGLLASGAHAQEIDFNLTVLSDYRFRGYSLSDEQPALQGEVAVSGASGFYGWAWASTIDEYGQDASGEGATVELDFGAGRAFSLGAYDLDLGVSLYTYPGGHDVNYVEIPVSVSRQAGAWAWKLGAEYAPAQSNLGDEDNTYVYGTLNIAPDTWPVSVNAALGWEDGAYADKKTDWSLGVTKAFGPVSLSATYVGTDAPGVGDALVGSLGVAF